MGRRKSNLVKCNISNVLILQYKIHHRRRCTRDSRGGGGQAIMRNSCMPPGIFFLVGNSGRRICRCAIF